MFEKVEVKEKERKGEEFRNQDNFGKKIEVLKMAESKGSKIKSQVTLSTQKRNLFKNTRKKKGRHSEKMGPEKVRTIVDLFENMKKGDRIHQTKPTKPSITNNKGLSTK